MVTKLSLREVVGNKDVVRMLLLSSEAAKIRNRPVPHVLLKGPPGTGKSSLAEALAAEMGVELRVLTSVTAKSNEDLRDFFYKLPDIGYSPEGEITGKIALPIVFCDEIHQLSQRAQENLGIAMQDWRLPVRVNGQDRFEWVPRFTLVGATTLPGKLTIPFLSRFPLQLQLDYYDLEESSEIVKLHAHKRGVVLEEGVAEEIARRGRGVGRILVRFLEQAWELATIQHKRDPRNVSDNYITLQTITLLFDQLLKIDELGLNQTDYRVLVTLAKAGRPLGLDNLVVISGEDKTSVTNLLEPYLIKLGLIERTPRGRIITQEGEKLLLSKKLIDKASRNDGPKRLL